MANTITIALSKGKVNVQRRELTPGEEAARKALQQEYHAEVLRLRDIDAAVLERHYRREALLDRLLDEEEANRV
jgi:hypothetical protein